MAGPFDIYMTMLFVDQGMGNLLTVTTAGTNDIVSNSLIDFGSQRSRRVTETVNFVYRVLTNNGANDAELDLVTISHKDKDHWSLFPHLLGKFRTENKQLQIKRLKYGGYANTYNKIKYEKSKKTILAILKTKTPDDYVIADFLNSKSAYSENQPLGSLLQLGANSEINLVPVAVNATTNKTDPSTVANTPSLAISIQYTYDESDDMASIFLPGDATADTLLFINENVFTREAARDAMLPWMMSVPHHGSLHSIASNYSTNNPSLDVANKFAELIDAHSIGASAGFSSTYHHPHDSVFDIFRPYDTGVPDDHPYVSYFPGAIPKGTWKVTTNTEGIFTNYVSYDPNGVSQPKRILFKLDSAGEFSVHILEPNSNALAASARRSFTALPAVTPAADAD